MFKLAASNPFRYRLFTMLWTGTALSNIGLWMQNVGAAWQMAALTPSVFMIALVQAAATAPTFLVGLPAGVLADLVDRRRLLMLAQAGMFASAGALAATAWLRLLTPWLLLGLTFALGTCSALSSTVRQASVSDVVPRVAMVSALGFSGIAYNGARAVGPGLAGMLLVWHGAGAVFGAIVLLFALTLLIQLFGYDPVVAPRGATEAPLAAMRSGLRYVWHASHLRPAMVRTVVFVGAASSLWALLPVVARDNPSFGAGGYATMLGCMGGGAVASGFALGALRARLSLDTMATVAGCVFAAAIFSAALVPSLPPLCIALFAGGTAWVLNNSSINAAYQTSLPSWVRARALSVRLLIFQGTMAAGSVVWGAIASHWGCSAALCCAGVLTLAGLWITTRQRIVLGMEEDFAPALISATTTASGPREPGDGPLVIEIEYRIDVARADQFLAHVAILGAARRRDGARDWDLYRDAGAPDRFVERFMVASSTGYKRLQERATRADAALEETVRAFHVGRHGIRMTQFVAVKFALHGKPAGTRRNADQS